MSVVLLICAIYEITAERNVKLIITYFIFGIIINPKFAAIISKNLFQIKNGRYGLFFIWYVVWWNLCNIKTVHISSIII